MALRRRTNGQHPRQWEDLAQVVAEGYLVFHPSRERAAEQGSPSQARSVEDHRYESAADAMRAATERTPSARASAWIPASTFNEWLCTDRFRRRLQPEAADLRPRQTLLVVAVSWAIAGTLTVGATMFGWQLLDTTSPSTGALDELKDTVVVGTWLTIVGCSFSAAHSAHSWMRRVLMHHNLDGAINEGGGESLIEMLRDELRRAARDATGPPVQLPTGKSEYPPNEAEESRTPVRTKPLRGRRREPGRHEAPRPAWLRLLRRGRGTP